MGWLKDEGLLRQMLEKLPAQEKSAPAAVVKSIGKLAVTEDELKKIRIPVKVFVGDRDPMKKLFVEPLQTVRKDWDVVVIKDAGHINCLLKPQFKEGLLAWLKQNAGK
jgi:hypothetical protein